MNDFEVLKEKKEKAELVKSEQYQKVRVYQLERIIELAATEIDEKELKGMLKLIKYTDDWQNDKKLKNNNN